VMRWWLLLALPAAAFGAMEIRMGSGETDLARYREYGYNAAVLGSFTQLATYSEIAPRALPPGNPLRAKVDENRRDLQERLRTAAKLGLKACLSTDEILLPTAVLEYFAGKITLDHDPKRVDLEKEEFWRIYRAKYREVLRDFPEIAYVMVRTGENYSFLSDGYSGQLIAERTSSATRSDGYFRNMQRMINETRKIVVDEFHRKLIWRTWDLGNYGFHASPEVYDRVLTGVSQRAGLIFAIKFTQTDYWRYNDFNPNIGRGGVEQIVEFQCAREYEGKGAYPDFVGPEHAEAMRKVAAARGVKGVWLWNFGGGWGGPFLKSDRWVRANIYATAKLAENQGLSPRALAQEWAVKEFGKAAAPKVAEMLMLSPECVLRFRYVAPYARRNKGWLPSRNIMRDDIIRGGKDVLTPLYDGSKDSLNEALEEKLEAVRLAQRMRRTFESAQQEIIAARGPAIYRESLNSILYMEALAKVMAHYVRGMFQYERWRQTGNKEIGSAARNELVEWRKAWDYYRNEIGKLEGVASLYRSLNSQQETDTRGAMEDLCEAALAALPAPARSSLPIRDPNLEERAGRLRFGGTRLGAPYARPARNSSFARSISACM